MKDFEKNMLSFLGIFVLSHSKKITSKFIHGKDDFFSVIQSYQDTKSFFIQIEQHQKLKETGYGGIKLGQGKNDYGVDRNFFGLFLTP